MQTTCDLDSCAFKCLSRCTHATLVWLQAAKLQGSATIGPFGPIDPHQHDMSHANKLSHLAYSKRAHSEWSLLQKWEADVEKLSIQERKELLAKLKVGCHSEPTHHSDCSVPALLMSAVSSAHCMPHL